MKALLPLLVILLVAPLHTATAEEPIFELIDARLELMRAVAAYKWELQLPIEDRAREKVVLDKARLAALKAGIAPDAALGARVVDRGLWNVGPHIQERRGRAQQGETTHRRVPTDLPVAVSNTRALCPC